MLESIGFIGLGAMGLPIALNLHKAGYQVLGLDITAARNDAYRQAGGRVASDAAQLYAECDCIITMLPEGSHVQSAIESLVSSNPKARLVIDLSTIGITHARQLHDALVGAGIEFLEAPVTGGVKGAADGTLTIMVAGEQAVFQAHQTLFDAVGRHVVFAGGPGCAQAVKLCNNMAAGIMKIAVSEAFALSRRLGVDDAVMFDVASRGSANCFALTQTCPVPGLVPSAPSSRGYTNGFATRLMLKDMQLAQSAAAAAGVPTTVAAAATSIFQHCCNNGMGELDNSIVFEFVSGR